MDEPILHGKTIYLRPLKESDADGNYPSWFNDLEVCKYNDHGFVKNTPEMTLEYIKSVKESQDKRVFAIIDKETEKHIGNISLQKINFTYKNAEIAIIIGEKDYWGRGIGKEAWELVMTYGFKTLNLHRLYCGTHEENKGMQKVALLCGMKEEGRLKHAMFKNGKYVDVILYGKINIS